MLGIAEQYFLAVAETGSFTKASELLFVSQPAVSRQIHLLEAELGFPLFTRTTRSVKLTPQGRILYEVLVESSNAWTRAVENAKQSHISDNNKLLLGLLNGWGIHRPPVSSIGMVQKLHPEIDVTIQQYNYREMTKRLLSGHLDLILTVESEVAPFKADIGWRSTLKSELILYMSNSNPAAQLEDPFPVLTEPVYVMGHEASSTSYDYMKDFVESRGWHMPVKTLPNIDSIYAAVDSGVGYAFTCLNSRICDSPDYKYYRLNAPMDLVFAWRLDRYNKNMNIFLNEFERLSQSDA